MYAEKIVKHIRGRQHPSYYYDNLLLGWVYQNTGHVEMALGYYNRAKELLSIHSIEDKRMVAVYWYLAYFYQHVYSDAEKSYHFLRLAVDLLNDQPNLYLESFIYSDLGNYYYQKKDFAGAIREFSYALDVNPESEESRIWLASAYGNTGDVDEASWQIEQLRVSGREISPERLEGIIPFKDPGQRRVFIDGLEKAGIGTDAGLK